jgi:hypothetical protein
MAKKDGARDPRLVAGKKLLDQWGVTLARVLDHSVTPADIEGRIGQEAAADVALAALLGDCPAAESAKILTHWETVTHDKALRREIHRSLYKLTQKGIKIDKPEPEPRRSVLTPIEPEGYLSIMDGRGDRLLWLVKPRVGGGLHYVSAMVNEPEGMRFVEGGEITRKTLRAMRKDMLERMQMNMVETSWRYCDAIMQEGYDRAHERNGGKAVESYPALRSHVASTPAQPVETPIPAALDQAAITADEELLVTSVRLLEEPELQRWLLDPERAKPYIDQISQVQESPLVLNRYQQQGRLQTIVEKAIGEIFSPENSKSYARRLEEATLHFAATERLDAARRALAVAFALKRNPQGGKGVVFCEELVRQSIALYYQAERQQEKEAAPGSLIMRPSEFAARMQAAQRQRVR